MDKIFNMITLEEQIVSTINKQKLEQFEQKNWRSISLNIEHVIYIEICMTATTYIWLIHMLIVTIISSDQGAPTPLWVSITTSLLPVITRKQIKKLHASNSQDQWSYGHKAVKTVGRPRSSQMAASTFQVS